MAEVKKKHDDVKRKGKSRVQVHIRLKECHTDKKATFNIFTGGTQLHIPATGGKKDVDKWYGFDHVFSTSATNKEVYSLSGYDLVENSLKGFNTAIFAYGQQGSGKTRTLMSKDGVTAHMVSHLFSRIAADPEHTYYVSFSYFHIYNENIYDLLNPFSDAPCSIREHKRRGTYVENITRVLCENPMDVYEMINVGRKSLIVAETKINERSSRSHAICQITIEKRSLGNSSTNRSVQFRKDRRARLGSCSSLPDIVIKDDDFRSPGSVNISKSGRGTPDIPAFRRSPSLTSEEILTRQRRNSVNRTGGYKEETRSSTLKKRHSLREDSLPSYAKKGAQKRRNRSEMGRRSYLADYYQRTNSTRHDQTDMSSESLCLPYDRRMSSSQSSVMSSQYSDSTASLYDFESDDCSSCCSTLFSNEDNSEAKRELKRKIGINSKISIIDLAGSDRIKISQSDQHSERLKEAQNINLSLHELGNVISALASRKRHVPYRNSVLTRFLQGGLGRKCRITFLLCVSSRLTDMSETKCTLEFGQKLKPIKPIKILEDVYKKKYDDLTSYWRDIEKNKELMFQRQLKLAPEERSRSCDILDKRNCFLFTEDHQYFLYNDFENQSSLKDESYEQKKPKKLQESQTFTKNDLNNPYELTSDTSLSDSKNNSQEENEEAKSWDSEFYNKKWDIDDLDISNILSARPASASASINTSLLMSNNKSFDFHVQEIPELFDHFNSENAPTATLDDFSEEFIYCDDENIEDLSNTTMTEEDFANEEDDTHNTTPLANDSLTDCQIDKTYFAEERKMYQYQNHLIGGHSIGNNKTGNSERKNGSRNSHEKKKSKKQRRPSSAPLIPFPLIISSGNMINSSSRLSLRGLDDDEEDGIDIKDGGNIIDMLCAGNRRKSASNILGCSELSLDLQLEENFADDIFLSEEPSSSTPRNENDECTESDILTSNEQPKEDSHPDKTFHTSGEPIDNETASQLTLNDLMDPSHLRSFNPENPLTDDNCIQTDKEDIKKACTSLTTPPKTKKHDDYYSNENENNTSAIQNSSIERNPIKDELRDTSITSESCGLIDKNAISTNRLNDSKSKESIEINNTIGLPIRNNKRDSITTSSFNMIDDVTHSEGLFSTIDFTVTNESCNYYKEDCNEVMINDSLDDANDVFRFENEIDKYKEEEEEEENVEVKEKFRLHYSSDNVKYEEDLQSGSKEIILENAAKNVYAANIHSDDSSIDEAVLSDASENMDQSGHNVNEKSATTDSYTSEVNDKGFGDSGYQSLNENTDSSSISISKNSSTYRQQYHTNMDWKEKKHPIDIKKEHKYRSIYDVNDKILEEEDCDTQQSQKVLSIDEFAHGHHPVTSDDHKNTSSYSRKPRDNLIPIQRYTSFQKKSNDNFDQIIDVNDCENNSYNDTMITKKKSDYEIKYASSQRCLFEDITADTNRNCNYVLFNENITTSNEEDNCTDDVINVSKDIFVKRKQKLVDDLDEEVREVDSIVSPILKKKERKLVSAASLKACIDTEFSNNEKLIRNSLENKELLDDITQVKEHTAEKYDLKDHTQEKINTTVDQNEENDQVLATENDNEEVAPKSVARKILSSNGLTDFLDRLYLMIGKKPSASISDADLCSTEESNEFIERNEEEIDRKDEQMMDENVKSVDEGEFCIDEKNNGTLSKRILPEKIDLNLKQDTPTIDKKHDPLERYGNFTAEKVEKFERVKINLTSLSERKNYLNDFDNDVSSICKEINDFVSKNNEEVNNNESQDKSSKIRNQISDFTKCGEEVKRDSEYTYDANFESVNDRAIKSKHYKSNKLQNILNGKYPGFIEHLSETLCKKAIRCFPDHNNFIEITKCTPIIDLKESNNLTYSANEKEEELKKKTESNSSDSKSETLKPKGSPKKVLKLPPALFADEGLTEVSKEEQTASSPITDEYKELDTNRSYNESIKGINNSEASTSNPSISFNYTAYNTLEREGSLPTSSTVDSCDLIDNNEEEEPTGSLQDLVNKTSYRRPHLNRSISNKSSSSTDDFLNDTLDSDYGDSGRVRTIKEQMSDPLDRLIITSSSSLDTYHTADDTSKSDLEDEIEEAFVKNKTQDTIDEPPLFDPNESDIFIEINKSEIDYNTFYKFLDDEQLPDIGRFRNTGLTPLPDGMNSGHSSPTENRNEKHDSAVDSASTSNLDSNDVIGSINLNSSDYSHVPRVNDLTSTMKPFSRVNNSIFKLYSIDEVEDEDKQLSNADTIKAGSDTEDSSLAIDVEITYDKEDDVEMDSSDKVNKNPTRTIENEKLIDNISICKDNDKDEEPYFVGKDVEKETCAIQYSNEDCIKQKHVIDTVLHRNQDEAKFQLYDEGVEKVTYILQKHNQVEKDTYESLASEDGNRTSKDYDIPRENGHGQHYRPEEKSLVTDHMSFIKDNMINEEKRCEEEENDCSDEQAFLTDNYGDDMPSCVKDNMPIQLACSKEKDELESFEPNEDYVEKLLLAVNEKISSSTFKANDSLNDDEGLYEEDSIPKPDYKTEGLPCKDKEEDDLEPSQDYVDQLLSSVNEKIASSPCRDQNYLRKMAADDLELVQSDYQSDNCLEDLDASEGYVDELLATVKENISSSSCKDDYYFEYVKQVSVQENSRTGSPMMYKNEDNNEDYVDELLATVKENRSFSCDDEHCLKDLEPNEDYVDQLLLTVNENISRSKDLVDSFTKDEGELPLSGRSHSSSSCSRSIIETKKLNEIMSFNNSCKTYTIKSASSVGVEEGSFEQDSLMRGDQRQHRIHHSITDSAIGEDFTNEDSLNQIQKQKQNQIQQDYQQTQKSNPSSLQQRRVCDVIDDSFDDMTDTFTNIDDITTDTSTTRRNINMKKMDNIDAQDDLDDSLEDVPDIADDMDATLSCNNSLRDGNSSFEDDDEVEEEKCIDKDKHLGNVNESMKNNNANIDSYSYDNNNDDVDDDKEIDFEKNVEFVVEKFYKENEECESFLTSDISSQTSKTSMENTPIDMQIISPSSDILDSFQYKTNDKNLSAVLTTNQSKTSIEKESENMYAKNRIHSTTNNYGIVNQCNSEVTSRTNKNDFSDKLTTPPIGSNNEKKRYSALFVDKTENGYIEIHNDSLDDSLETVSDIDSVDASSFLDSFKNNISYSAKNSKQDLCVKKQNKIRRLLPSTNGFTSVNDRNCGSESVTERNDENGKEKQSVDETVTKTGKLIVNEINGDTKAEMKNKHEKLEDEDGSIIDEDILQVTSNTPMVLSLKYELGSSKSTDSLAAPDSSLDEHKDHGDSQNKDRELNGYSTGYSVSYLKNEESEITAEIGSDVEPDLTSETIDSTSTNQSCEQILENGYVVNKIPRNDARPPQIPKTSKSRKSGKQKNKKQKLIPWDVHEDKDIILKRHDESPVDKLASIKINGNESQKSPLDSSEDNLNYTEYVSDELFDIKSYLSTSENNDGEEPAIEYYYDAKDSKGVKRYLVNKSTYELVNAVDGLLQQLSTPIDMGDNILDSYESDVKNNALNLSHNDSIENNDTSMHSQSSIDSTAVNKNTDDYKNDRNYKQRFDDLLKQMKDVEKSHEIELNEYYNLLEEYDEEKRRKVDICQQQKIMDSLQSEFDYVSNQYNESKKKITELQDRLTQKEGLLLVIDDELSKLKAEFDILLKNLNESNASNCVCQLAADMMPNYYINSVRNTDTNNSDTDAIGSPNSSLYDTDDSSTPTSPNDRKIAAQFEFMLDNSNQNTTDEGFLESCDSIPKINQNNLTSSKAKSIRATSNVTMDAATNTEPTNSIDIKPVFAMPAPIMVTFLKSPIKCIEEKSVKRDAATNTIMTGVSPDVSFSDDVETKTEVIEKIRSAILVELIGLKNLCDCGEIKCAESASREVNANSKKDLCSALLKDDGDITEDINTMFSDMFNASPYIFSQSTDTLKSRSNIVSRTSSKVSKISEMTPLSPTPSTNQDQITYLKKYLQNHKKTIDKELYLIFQELLVNDHTLSSSKNIDSLSQHELFDKLYNSISERDSITTNDLEICHKMLNIVRSDHTITVFLQALLKKEIQNSCDVKACESEYTNGIYTGPKKLSTEKEPIIDEVIQQCSSSESGISSNDSNTGEGSEKASKKEMIESDTDSDSDQPQRKGIFSRFLCMPRRSRRSKKGSKRKARHSLA